MNKDLWKHRSKGMVCGTCMWSLVKVPNNIEDGNPKPLGRCRRRAPTMNGYPAVFADDWCGDHKLDETKIGGKDGTET
ncbi:MAG: hypothetical protein PF440_11990 [Thiomicrorhabdus sp.]|jgi:hypothetical protein|nr:hypothetical protein [Thiomicrorhabdus sp.]